MGEGALTPPRAAPLRVRFTGNLARAICERVAGGETIQAICRDAGMPNRGTVSKWARERRPFRERLSRAQTLGGWEPGRGRRGGYCEVTGREIFARLCEGETMKSICADPAMPSAATVARWRDADAAFDERLDLARKVQAERFCDLGWEIALAVTPKDAYATHVKLLQLRWTAAAMAPERFGRFKPVEAAVTVEKAPQVISFRPRHFEVVVGPTGEKRVREIPRLEGDGEADD